MRNGSDEVSKKKPEGPKYDWLTIATFFCKHLGVSDVMNIEPFGKRIPAWLLCTNNVLGVEASTNGAIFDVRGQRTPEEQVVKVTIANSKLSGDPQPKDPFKHPKTEAPLASDLTRVCIYNVACRHYRSNVPLSLAIRLNFYNEPMAELQQTKEQDHMFQAAGAVRGAFTALQPTSPEGKDMSDIPLSKLGFAYLNEFFIRTMALINETNLMNGIIKIPHEVCLAARLPVFRGMPEPNVEATEKLFRSMKIDSQSEEHKAKREEMVNGWKASVYEQYKDAKQVKEFYAIPINHVLAWGYQSEEFASQQGHHAEQFRFTPPNGTEGGCDPVLLYYMIPDTQFDSLLQNFKDTWLGRVDMKSLSEVGFEFVPIPESVSKDVPPEAVQVTGSVSLRAHFTYYSFPALSMDTINNMLAPTLEPGFPPSRDWSVDEVARQVALQEHYEKTNKK